MKNSIAIIDLGGQYCHLIGRRLHRLSIHSRIYRPETRAQTLGGHAGIILSGGPQSVYEEGAPKISQEVLQLKVPILGICYGHQLLAQMLGAKVEKGRSEYGEQTLRRFVSSICGLKVREDATDQIKPLVRNIRARVGKKSVFFLVSGGGGCKEDFSLFAQPLPQKRIL